MKHINITILLALLMSMAGAKAWAYDIAVENEDGVTICYSYSNDGKELKVVCSSWSDYSSQYNKNGFHGKIKGHLNIPETVNYKNRTRKVTSIENCSFINCSGISSVTIPNSVISIGNSAFSGCSGLTSITIGNSVTTIEDYAFEKCSSLTSIDIPNSVTSIGKYVFNFCSSLTSLTIGSGVTSIGEEAFHYCKNLQKVIVKDLAAWCNIEFVNNSLYFDHHLYSDENTEITDLVIPEGVTSIGKYAFEGCSGLTSVTIPNSVTTIGSRAFYNCYSLEEVHISDIASWCAIKFEYYYEGNNPLEYAKHLFLNGEEVKDLIIPNSVTNIDNHAFYGCTGFTSVTIPNSVTSIGSAFYSCKNLVEVISLIKDPNNCNCYGNSFDRDVYMNATLYVPLGTIEKYKAESGWKSFIWMEEGVPSAISKPTVTEKKGIASRYTLDGAKASKEKKGINIIKTENGITRKVLVK